MSAILDKIRDHYVDQYLAFVEAQKTKTPDGVTELKLQLGSEAKLYRNLYCVDFFAGGQVVELSPEFSLEFDPVEAHVGAMHVYMYSLRWDAVSFLLDVAYQITPNFEGWFNVWFDVEDARNGTDQAGIIHSVSVDEKIISVDFGTAPVDAFTDLLNVLANDNVQHVVIRTEMDAGDKP